MPPLAGLSEHDWEILLRRIRDGACTPFLGAGASSGTIPLGSEIAERWASEHNYPLEDSQNLARVAQYLAITRDPMTPKELLRDLFIKIRPPDFSRRATAACVCHDQLR